MVAADSNIKEVHIGPATTSGRGALEMMAEQQVGIVPRATSSPAHHMSPRAAATVGKFPLRPWCTMSLSRRAPSAPPLARPASRLAPATTGRRRPPWAWKIDLRQVVVSRGMEEGSEGMGQEERAEAIFGLGAGHRRRWQRPAGARFEGRGEGGLAGEGPITPESPGRRRGGQVALVVSGGVVMSHLSGKLRYGDTIRETDCVTRLLGYTCAIISKGLSLHQSIEIQLIVNHLSRPSDLHPNGYVQCP